MMDYKEFIERYEKLDDIGKKDVSEAFEVIKELAAKLEASDKQLEVYETLFKEVRKGYLSIAQEARIDKALTRIAELNRKDG